MAYYSVDKNNMLHGSSSYKTVLLSLSSRMPSLRGCKNIGVTLSCGTTFSRYLSLNRPDGLMNDGFSSKYAPTRWLWQIFPYLWLKAWSQKSRNERHGACWSYSDDTIDAGIYHERSGVDWWLHISFIFLSINLNALEYFEIFFNDSDTPMMQINGIKRNLL